MITDSEYIHSWFRHADFFQRRFASLLISVQLKNAWASKNLTHNRCEDMSLCIIRSIDHRFLRLEAACVPCFDYLLHEIVVDGSEMRPRRIRSFSSYCPWGLMTTRRISNEAGLTINH